MNEFESQREIPVRVVYAAASEKERIVRAHLDSLSKAPVGGRTDLYLSSLQLKISLKRLHCFIGTLSR